MLAVNKELQFDAVWPSERARLQDVTSGHLTVLWARQRLWPLVFRQFCHWSTVFVELEHLPLRSAGGSHANRASSLFALTVVRHRRPWQMVRSGLALICRTHGGGVTMRASGRAANLFFGKSCRWPRGKMHCSRSFPLCNVSFLTAHAHLQQQFDGECSACRLQGCRRILRDARLLLPVSASRARLSDS